MAISSEFIKYLRCSNNYKKYKLSLTLFPESKFPNNLNKEENFLIICFFNSVDCLLELKMNFDIKYGGALISILNFSNYYICGHCFSLFKILQNILHENYCLQEKTCFDQFIVIILLPAYLQNNKYIKKVHYQLLSQLKKYM